MKLKDMQKIINHYCNDLNKGDCDVVIKLDEPSIGFIACEYVDEIYSGMDWDMGRILITAKKELIHKTKDRDNPVPIKHDPVFPKRFVCTACGGYIHKNDNYCCSCGQKLQGDSDE